MSQNNVVCEGVFISVLTCFGNFEQNITHRRGNVLTCIYLFVYYAVLTLH